VIYILSSFFSSFIFHPSREAFILQEFSMLKKTIAFIDPGVMAEP